MGYCSRRPHCKHHLSVKSRKLRLQFAQACKNSKNGLMSLHFCRDDRLVGSEFVKHGSTLPSIIVHLSCPSLVTRYCGLLLIPQRKDILISRKSVMPYDMYPCVSHMANLHFTTSTLLVYAPQWIWRLHRYLPGGKFSRVSTRQRSSSQLWFAHSGFDSLKWIWKTY